MDRLRTIVHHHDRDTLAKCEVPDDWKVCYDDLKLPESIGDNRFGDSRILYHLSTAGLGTLDSCDYLALFPASFGLKFTALPSIADIVKELEPHLTQARIFAPLVCQDYLAQAKSCHAGMELAIESLLPGDKLTRRVDLQVPLANIIVAHREVWRSMLRIWLSLFGHASSYYDSPPWDLTTDFTRNRRGQGPAYLCERFMPMWFSNQDDLQVIRLIGAGNHSYYCWEKPTDSIPVAVQSTICHSLT